MAAEKRIVKVDISNSEKGLRVIAENASMEQEPERLVIRGFGFEDIAHQTPVNAIVYFEDGVQLFSGEVTLSMASQINVRIVAALSEKRERRSSVKIKTSFDAWAVRMSSVTGRGSMKINVPLRVRDLSAGGVGFFCDHPFFRKQSLLLDMSYLGENFKLDFRILRKERAKAHMFDSVEERRNVRFKYRYGGCISNITDEQERLIMEHVFRIQVLERAKRIEAE
jgi:hypothetical protein